MHNGHKWLVLMASLPWKDQVDISLWRNQDQNENQGSHEIELLQTIYATCEEMKSSTAGTCLMGGPRGQGNSKDACQGD